MEGQTSEGASISPEIVDSGDGENDGRLDSDSIPAFIAAIFGDQADTAVRVFLGCENKEADPYAKSWDGSSYGIAQLHKLTWRDWLNDRGFDWETEWFILERNLAMAYTILTDPTTRGWREWDCW